jgi:hypothetical protein
MLPLFTIVLWNILQRLILDFILCHINFSDRLPSVLQFACFSSPELNVQVSFSDRLFSVVRLFVRLPVNFYIFDIYSRNTGPILTRLGKNHPWEREFKIVQIKLKIAIFPYKILLINRIQTSWLLSPLIPHKKWKTWDILITHYAFRSNLTGSNFCTKSFENLTWKSSNIVYVREFNLCGLIYVGETKGVLHERISGHRFQINDPGNQLLYMYIYFNSPDHFSLPIIARIFEIFTTILTVLL